MTTVVGVLHLAAAGMIMHTIRTGHETEERWIHFTLVLLAGVLATIGQIVGADSGH